MGGGLMQLVAYGAQDIYLTGNPQITFFKVVYRRHTNFSMESIQQTFSGGGGNNPVCTISRNGDLVHKMYLVQTGAYAPQNRVNQPIITVELEIGGQRIDRQSGQWMDTWNELSTPESKAIGLKAMTGQIGTTGTAVEHVHIPLLFWFCRNPGLALPLIALQYHEVKVKFTLAVAATPFELYCDYIYLDTDERRRFAQVSHEYLIEQVQEQSTVGGGLATSTSNKLNFNHPVKELIWSTTVGAKPATVGLKLNGHDRFSARNDEYFYLQQPYDYHTAVPRQNLPDAAQLSSNYTKLEGAGTDAVGGGSIQTVQTMQSMAAASIGNELVTSSTITPTNATTIGYIAVAALPPTGASNYFGGTGPFAGAGNANGIGTGVQGSVKDLEPNAIGFFMANDTADAAGFIKANVGRVFRLTIVGADLATSTTAVVKNVTLKGVQVGSGSGAGAVNTTATVVSFEQNIFNADTSHLAFVSGSAGFKITKVEILTPDSALVTQARTSKDTKSIGVYSFALKPEEHQPSGTCNFSRIDNAELNFTAGSTVSLSSTDVIYAVNYNVLRIMSGMGGLAYSN